LARLPGWLEYVNTPQTEAELAALRRSVNHGRPFGEPSWATQMACQLGLQSTLRPQGRPKKPKNGS
jgi:putative transposase